MRATTFAYYMKWIFYFCMGLFAVQFVILHLSFFAGSKLEHVIHENTGYASFMAFVISGALNFCTFVIVKVHGFFTK